jgi:hypothetical protein
MTIVSSIKVQQACASKLCFILACASTIKHLNQRHKVAYIEGSHLGFLQPELVLTTPLTIARKEGKSSLTFNLVP